MISLLAKSIINDIKPFLAKADLVNPESLAPLKNDIQQQLESTLEGFNIISRKEFDLQRKTLARLNAQIAALSTQVEQLESAVNTQHEPKNKQ